MSVTSEALTLTHSTAEVTMHSVSKSSSSSLRSSTIRLTRPLKRIICIISLVACVLGLYAQVSVESKIDSIEILIGEQTDLSLIHI